MHLFKMAINSKTAGRRAKLTEVWDSGTLVSHIYGGFDLVVFTDILLPFGVYILIDIMQNL